MPLKLTRRHGSPYWYLRGTVRGRRVDESTGVVERADAETIRVKREAEITQRSIFGDAVSRTFGEAALSYLENGGERGEHVTLLIGKLGKLRLAAVGQHEIETAAKKLYPKAAPSTRNRKAYTPAVAILHHAAKKGWCSKPVIARPAVPKGRVRWVSYGEAERLIAAASPALRPLVLFLFSTGARISEALYLDWRQVDLSAGQVVFLDTKNGDDRGVPLHPRVVATLANLKGRKGAVFRRPDGQPYGERKGGGGVIKTAWRGMCARAEVSDFTPHDCRHTWATWHYAANRDLPALMELGGWKSVEMVMRYAHVNTQHLAHTINRLWGTEAESAPEKSPNRDGTFSV